jgi:hypothetical protein
MAGDWIKMRKDLHGDPAVIGIGVATGLDLDTVVGKLHRLWAWADTHTIDGNAPSVTESYVDTTLGCAGFARAMVAQRWLKLSRGGVLFPNFDKHNGQTGKARALTANRVDKSRNAGGVTKSLPEKRREEKSSSSKEEPRQIEIPSDLDIPEFREAWAEFLAMRKEIKKPLRPTGTAAVLKKLQAFGCAKAIRALRDSTAGQWQGVFDPDRHEGRQAGRVKRAAL